MLAGIAEKFDDSRVDDEDLRWTLSKRIRSAGCELLVIDDAHCLDADSSAVSGWVLPPSLGLPTLTS